MRNASVAERRGHTHFHTIQLEGGMSNRTKLKTRIALARAFAPRRSGIGYGIQDFIAPETEEVFEARLQEAQLALGQLWQATNTLLNLHESFEISPVIAAIHAKLEVEGDLVGLDQANGAIDAIRLLSALPLDDYLAVALASKRGNAASRDTELDATVQAIMHHLYVNGKPYRGGWHRPKKREVPAQSRTDDSEWKLQGAAAFIVNAVRTAGFDCQVATIKGAYDKYIRTLGGSTEHDEGNGDRHPRASDYLWAGAAEALDLEKP